MNLGQLSLKGRALKLLSAREHTRAELQRRLAAHEQEPGQLQALLDELTARGYLSDARAADALAHRRAGKLGAARVAHELRARGTADGVTREVVGRLMASEFDRAREVWRKKFGVRPTDAAQWARQARFLAARGFGAETVRRVMGAAGEADGQE